MIPIFIPGSRCLLDGKTEVIVLKAITRSHSTYNVEIPGHSFETVAYDRLKLIDTDFKKQQSEDVTALGT